MKICLIALDDTYGNICGIAAALSTHAEVTCVLGQRSKKEMWRQFPEHKLKYRNIPTGQDVYIIVSGITALQLKWDCSKPTIFVFTGTRYIHNKDTLNELSKKAIATFAMPNLYQYRDGLPTHLFYQPFNLMEPAHKPDRLFVTHSPFHKNQLKYKGTAHIEPVLKEIGCDHQVIMYKTWQETLAIKEKSHIFIDQVRVGKTKTIGIGKSGLEAMLLKCAVMSECYFPEGDIPHPPVVHTTAEGLQEDLLSLMDDRDGIDRIAQEQYQWAKKYTSYEFVARRIMECVPDQY